MFSGKRGGGIITYQNYGGLGACSPVKIFKFTILETARETTHTSEMIRFSYYYSLQFLEGCTLISPSPPPPHTQTNLILKVYLTIEDLKGVKHKHSYYYSFKRKVLNTIHTVEWALYNGCGFKIFNYSIQAKLWT